MGLLLYVLASILWIPLTIINLVLVLIKYLKTQSFLKVIDGFFLSTAVDIDKFGNRNFRTLFNATLKKSNGIAFGKMDETISSVLGKNQRDNTLSKTGKILANLLDWIDTDHCKKSIKD